MIVEVKDKKDGKVIGHIDINEEFPPRELHIEIDLGNGGVWYIGYNMSLSSSY